MNRVRLLLISAALAIVLIAGCSQEDLFSPSSGTDRSNMPMSAPFSTIGPSEIVICIDVSDSISAGELTAMVNALDGSLSNSSLIPQNGQVAVSALVYGDTTALVFGPTPVTSINLADSLLPALQNLLNDRLVGGNGADLSGGLKYSGSILDVAPVSDKHILVMGSGAADDPAAVETVCQELKLAGIMVSTVGVAPDAAGTSLLKSCALLTGGFFGEGDTGLDAICDEAFAYMLQVDIDLEPETAELLRGNDHTVTAKVFRAGNSDKYPVAALEVTIEVVSGPNLSEMITAPTDSSGVVTFMYNGDGGPGIDTIVSSALHPGTGTAMSDTVTVTWLNTPPSCDAGGPYDVTVDSDTAMVTLDATGSSDADGDTLAFFWSADCTEVEFDDVFSATPVVMITGDCLCVDSFTVTVMVSDGYDSTTCTSVVIIDDQRPPILVERDEPILLWPPNHKYHVFTPEMLLESAEDACGNPIELSSAVIIEVSSDEPEDHKGDGKTIDDIIVHCPNLVKLRSERKGDSNGRVYTIILQITAENGVSAEAMAKVVVPHDVSDPHAIEDEQGGYVVIPECGD